MAGHFKNFLWKWRGVAITTPAISLVVIGLRLIGALEPVELAMLDQFFRWRSPETTDSRIVIIGIDEADVRQYAWPIDDALLAQLLDKVRQQKPRAIGLDLARDKPVGTGYSQLASLFKSTPNLVGATKIADLVSSNFAITSSNIEPPPA
ncbi:MAG: CHASE2 domain-containing protein, partial [Pseudanabaena sp.]